MRMLAPHYASKAVPAIAKKKRQQRQNVTIPLNGLSLATRFSEGDPRTATLLTNFVIEDDRIRCRAGFKKRATRGTAPIWHLVPHYGSIQELAAASNGELWNAQNGDLLHAGFTSNDWHWTSFSNLGDKEYTVAVNGADGVWSWDGSLAPDAPPVNVLSLSSATEAVCTVDPTDIAKFVNGMRVNITGADAAHAAANGYHYIKNVGSPANTFTLIGVNTSVGTPPPQTTGVQADVLVGWVKEPVTANTADTWISVNNFNIVVSHQNRLFFADKANLAIYYLPPLQKDGEVAFFPLNAIFRRGGHIRAMYSWTTEGSVNMNDQLVVFTSNGECVILGGVDPDTDFTMSGLFRFDAPMSKHSVINYGGELYVMISTGLVPMSTLMRAEQDKLGIYDRNVGSIFLHDSMNYRNDEGWMLFFNPNTGRILCNMPQGIDNKYRQMVRHMPKDVWSEFNGLPARCFGFIEPFVYFGDDKGNTYEFHPIFQSDDGNAILVDVQVAWNLFKTSNEKHFTGVTSYLTTDGSPRPIIDMKVNFDYTPGLNRPDITMAATGSNWDEAIWDVDNWATGETAFMIWNGLCPSGTVGAVRLTAAIYNCQFSVTGWNVEFEEGN